MHLFGVFHFLSFLSFLSYTQLVVALTPAQWRSQAIYQVMTDRFARTDGSTTASCNLNDYCGGTWQGLIDHLDYVQNMGFTAIWISPVVKNLPQSTSDGSGYHGYWAQDIYSVNTNFGSAADLVKLSSALHSRGMYLMVDVVTNHMGYAGCGTCVQYDAFNPFNSQSYYHPFCLIDYNNQTSIQQCWEGDNIVSLPDLRTEDATVQNTWSSWITQLVANYTIDGLRIDSAQQVNTGFYSSFLTAAGIYAVGEVFNGDPNVVCPFQQYVNVLNYPAYYWITQAFQSTSGSISALANGIAQMKSTCTDTTLLGSFLENHDNPRFPSYTSDVSLAKNAIGFTLLADGIPILYQGQEQHFSGSSTPNNREAVWTAGYSTTSTLYTFISQINKIRRWAVTKDSTYVTYKASAVYSDAHTIAMRKGATGTQLVSVFTNLGNAGSGSISLPSSATAFTANQGITELLACRTYTTDGSGSLSVPIIGGQPLIFSPTSALCGSSLCPSSPPGGTTTLRANSTTLSTTRKASSTTSACVVASTVAVTFNESVKTTYGQTIKLAGSIPQLGSWNPADATTLSASAYTASDPVWQVTVNLPPSESFQYKFIKIATDGTVTWEADPNRAYTVSSCGGSVTIDSSWQG